MIDGEEETDESQGKKIYILKACYRNRFSNFLCLFSGSCEVDGETFANGDEMPKSDDPCEVSCTCKDGERECDYLQCHPKPNVEGMVCTEEFMDGECCPAFNCDAIEDPESGSQVTEAPEGETVAPTESPDEEDKTEASNESQEEEESQTDASTEEDTVTDTPTEGPTKAPTEEPTEAPTEAPTDAPTEAPTDAPTDAPTEKPTDASTDEQTDAPTEAPTETQTESAEEDGAAEATTEAETEVPATEGPTEEQPQKERNHEAETKYYTRKIEEFPNIEKP